MELRCTARILHGIVNGASGSIEVTCKSKRCGKRPGVVVLHTFNMSTGELVNTKLFKEPEETNRADCIARTALRAS